MPDATRPQLYLSKMPGCEGPDARREVGAGAWQASPLAWGTGAMPKGHSVHTDLWDNRCRWLV